MSLDRKKYAAVKAKDLPAGAFDLRCLSLLYIVNRMFWVLIKNIDMLSFSKNK